MAELDIKSSSTTEGLSVAPSMAPAIREARIGHRHTTVDSRVLYIMGVCLILGLAAGGIAQMMLRLIAFITNLCFFGRISSHFVTPAGNPLGAWVILIPVAGGLVIGLMARFGSEKIRGHGIPEAMEQVLFNESRIPARMTFLKPLSAAISIGTGGPFGAEGPVIATGGALGSLFGQLIETTASERKTLLAAGAAAGLTAIFGNPVSSVLIAIELLLFEFSPRSILPVAMACSVAAAVRIFFEGTGPAFPLSSALPGTTGAALAVYFIIGALIGVASVWVTDLITWIEHQFEKIPIHWMWYPAIGGLVVGLIGWKMPHTMGPGYDTIEAIIGGRMFGWTLVIFFVFKLISWATSVGSGTSGGTLAPMFAMGGCLAGAIAGGVAYLFPGLGVSPQVAALVGMAAIFAGASRALLASIVLAFETTHDFQGVLPLLAGCTAAYLVSGLMMKYTIMTEKFVRAGARVPEEFLPDPLSHIQVKDAATPDVVTVSADDSLEEVRQWLSTDTSETRHQAYPVVEGQGHLIGLVLRRELMNPAYGLTSQVLELVSRPPVVIFQDQSLQDALQVMLLEDVGRLIVLEEERHHGSHHGSHRSSPHASGQGPMKVRGILTRSDIHLAYQQQLRQSEQRERTIPLFSFGKQSFLK